MPVNSKNINQKLYNRRENEDKRDYSPLNNKAILEYAKEKNRGYKIKNENAFNKKSFYENNND